MSTSSFSLSPFAGAAFTLLTGSSYQVENTQAASEAALLVRPPTDTPSLTEFFAYENDEFTAERQVAQAQAQATVSPPSYLQPFDQNLQQVAAPSGDATSQHVDVMA